MSCNKEEGERMVQLIDEHGDQMHSLDDIAIQDVHVAAFLIKVALVHSVHCSVSSARCRRSS